MTNTDLLHMEWNKILIFSIQNTYNLSDLPHRLMPINFVIACKWSWVNRDWEMKKLYTQGDMSE